MNSIIKQVVKVVQIALPSSYVSNEIAGAKEVLEGWKRQYILQLQGIVINFKDVSLMPQSGFIGINIGKPCIHVNIKAKFDLFCPSVGHIMKGKINRISPGHIVCLVHGTILVSIQQSDDNSSELSRYLYLDKEILFQITSFDYHRKKINVSGKVTKECIKLMENSQEFYAESKPTKCRINPAISPHSENSNESDTTVLNSHKYPNDFNSFNNDILEQKVRRLIKKEMQSEESSIELTTPKKKKKCKDNNLDTTINETTNNFDEQGISFKNNYDSSEEKTLMLLEENKNQSENIKLNTKTKHSSKKSNKYGMEFKKECSSEPETVANLMEYVPKKRKCEESSTSPELKLTSKKRKSKEAYDGLVENTQVQLESNKKQSKYMDHNSKTKHSSKKLSKKFQNDRSTESELDSNEVKSFQKKRKHEDISTSLEVTLPSKKQKMSNDFSITDTKTKKKKDLKHSLKKKHKNKDSKSKRKNIDEITLKKKKKKSKKDSK